MIQHSGILKNNIDHLSKRGPPTFFRSDTNLVLGKLLVLFVEKTHVLIVTVELIWLLFLNILFLNYVQTLNKSHRVTKFRRSYTYTSLFSFKSTTVKCGLLFFAWCALLKATIFPFCYCLSVTIVHLRNLFLLSKLVAQMLLTPRWVNRQKDVIYLFINIW